MTSYTLKRHYKNLFNRLISVKLMYYQPITFYRTFIRNYFPFPNPFRVLLQRKDIFTRTFIESLPEKYNDQSHI